MTKDLSTYTIYIYTYISLLKGQRQFPRISSSVHDRMIQSCEECYRNETNILLSCVFAQCTLHAHNETSICLIMEQTRNIDITHFSYWKTGYMFIIFAFWRFVIQVISVIPFYLISIILFIQYIWYLYFESKNLIFCSFGFFSRSSFNVYRGKFCYQMVISTYM